MSLDLSISANSALRATLQNIAKTNSVLNTMISDNILTSEEVRRITTLDGLDMSVKLQIVEAYLKQTNPSTDTGSKSNTKTPYSETIDKEKTLALQKEIKTAQDQYNSAINKETGLREKLDKVNGEFETSRDALTKAVEKMTGAAEDASAIVNAQVNNILEAAKNGKMDKATAKSKLAAISVPSLNGQKLTLNTLQTEVENLSGKIESLSSVYQDVSRVVGDLANKYGSFLETNITTICVNTSGKIIVNEPATNGPAKTGADGISSLDVAKFASMSTDDLAKALESDTYKELFDSIKGSGATALTSTEAANVIKSLITIQSKGDASTFGTKGSGADINVLNGINKDELAAAAKKAQDAKAPPRRCDPYEITIDGKTYEFVKDNGDGKWDTADIFGINDSKDDIFASMKSADMNKDGSVSAEELAKMGIRLVQKENGKLQVNNPEKDFDLNKIDSINLKSLKSSNQNDGDVGTFGNFDMKLKDGRTIEGKQTFEKLSTLQKLFQNIGNTASGVISNIKNKFKLDPQTVEFYSKLGEFSAETSKIDKESTNISINSADSTIDSSKEAIDSAKSLNLGKDPNEAVQKPKEKPAESKTNSEDQKKKKIQEN